MGFRLLRSDLKWWAFGIVMAQAALNRVHLPAEVTTISGLTAGAIVAAKVFLFR